MSHHPRKLSSPVIIAASLSLLVAGLGGGGLFWSSCHRQSERCDLSRLVQDPQRAPLAEMPTCVMQAAAARLDIHPARAIAEKVFRLTGDGLRDRLVRRMVVGQIEEKFSPREIAEIYFNRVSPGAEALRGMMAANRPAPAAAAPDLTAAASSTFTPPEIAPLPPEQPEIPVRRAVAVASEMPVRRALPVNGDDLLPVRRAAPVETAWPRTAFRSVPRAQTATLSPTPIVRIAVVNW